MMGRCLQIFAAMIVAGVGATAWGGTIRVQAKAVVDEGAVRLGDVATLSGMGREGESLAEVVVLESLPKDGARVKAEQILFAVAAAKGMKATATLQIAGSADCLVSRRGSEAKISPVADAAAAVTVSTSNRVVTADNAEVTPARTATTSVATKKEAAKNTLAQIIAERLCTDLTVRRDDLRVDFETISPWLDTPVAGNQRWQFRSNSRSLGAVQWEAQLLEGTKVVAKVSILSKVTRRQTTVVAASAISRGDILTAKDLREEEMWLDRKLPTLAGKASDVVGLEATRSLAAGTMVDTRDFKAAEMAGRGEAITVYAVSGNLVIKGSARATEPGKLHDSIRVRNDSTGEIYPVTLIGKRLAAVGATVDAETEKKIKEMQ